MMVLRRRLAPLAVVLGVLASGSVTAACTTSPSGEVQLDPAVEEIITSGQAGGVLSAFLLVLLSTALLTALDIDGGLCCAPLTP